jgi:hypothetical protein
MGYYDTVHRKGSVDMAGKGSEVTQFRKGQAANPGGRPKLDPDSKELLRKNSAQAIRLMHDFLHDPTAFGKGGWIPPKDQLKYLDAAMTRVLGRPDVIAVSHQHTHAGNVSAGLSDRLRAIADKLPERRAQQRVIDAKVIEAQIPDETNEQD